MRRSLLPVSLILIAMLALGCQSGSNWLAKRMQESSRQSQLEKNLQTVKSLQKIQGNSPDYSPKGSSADYLEGYDDGFDSGYNQGSMDGSGIQPYHPTLKTFESGRSKYDQGYFDGYENGYDAGFREGTLAAAEAAEPSTPAQTETKDTGDYDAGHEAGFKIGYVQGKNDWVLGYGYYDYTPDDAAVEEHTSGRSDLYTEGWREGYKDGYVQAWQEQEGD